MPNTRTPEMPLFAADKLRAIDAIDRAQLIAFAPYVWEASRLLVDKGILQALSDHTEGLSITELEARINLSHYGLRVLLEAGLGIALVYRKSGKYFLAKTGHFLLHNEMTKVNFDFMKDVCAAGAPSLEASIENSKPEGLKTLGNWNTLYEGLSSFPEPAKSSWLAFDHFYSDTAFPEALPLIFEAQPKKILDIGGNTGKWTLQCLAADKEVHLGIVDLAGQLKMAEANINAAGYEGRVAYYDHNLLDPSLTLPTGYDTIWMSQFLDCFADEEIIAILKKCHKVCTPDTRVFINETFWDRQRFTTSAFALQMTSLYFTTMANGNSQMYDSEVFLKFIEEAGFEVVKQYDQVGLSHTIIELKKKA